MKKLLYAAGAALGIALAPAAHAGLLTAAAFDGVTTVALACAGGLNSTLVCSGSSTNYSNINIVAQGVPTLPDPDLSSLTINATQATGGTHTLTIQVFQTGINTVGPSTMDSTFTINHLIGAPFGPSALTDYINGTTSTLGTLLATGNFAAGLTNATIGSTNVVPGTITADAMQYVVTTTGAGQSMTDTIQLVRRVPEPASLALLGVGMLGLGFLRSRKKV